MHSHQKSLVSVKNIKKGFGNHKVLEDCNFAIHSGEKIGLVGPNGSGKSLLLKMVIGEISPDEGTIVVTKNSKIGYFPQSQSDHELSGGEAAKKVLVPLIATPVDLFLLDEPTNNLDSDGLEMLETFVTESSAAFFIVSHDREFLDKTVDTIIEINADTKTTSIYDGNYSDFIEQKSERIERQWKEYSDKVEKSKNYKTSVDEKIAWKGVLEKKRKTIRNLPIHEKEKPVASILRDKEGRMGRRARIIRERMEEHAEATVSVVKPRQQLPLHIQFEEEARGGTKVFELTNIAKQFPSKTIGLFSMSVQYGERILITGKNGSGKSTLLKMIIGEATPDSGEIKRGVGIRIGYLAQRDRIKESSENVLTYFMNISQLEVEESRKLLSRFRITNEDVQKQLCELSPGEYSRVMIALIAAKKPNCIILDEPTNHLDLEVMEELERALQAFKGTLIIVSHDRYFIKKLNITREIAL